jgi:hypothetical protein
LFVAKKKGEACVKTRRRGKSSSFIVLILTLIVCVGNHPNAQENKDPLFDSDEILDLELTYDINTFRKDWGKNRKYHPAKVSYRDDQGNEVSLAVKIRVRGRLRRTNEEFRCHVPNFKMKFNENQAENTIFESKRPLKLVLHCKRNSDEWQNYAINEYYAYRIFRILTDLSFKVRMARIIYVDSQKKVETFTKYGFFIENYKQMVKRIGAKPVKSIRVEWQQVDHPMATLNSVFQFMIGNTDWNILYCHNLRVVILKNRTKYTPIPYDFDMSGLVDAKYAAPHPDLRHFLPSVRIRLFRGFCKDLRQFERTFAIFNRHKEEILSLFRGSSLLTEKRKKRNIKYLEEFYKIINTPKLVKRHFINNYRGGTKGDPRKKK